MATLFSFLASAIGPLVIKALLALGIGTITFTGVTVALQGLIDIAVNNWAGLPTDILQLASIAGIPQAMGIVCGSFVARASMWAAVSATRWVTSA